MARKRKASDETYNARRRYRRQAERYQRKAEKASGAEAARYRTLARSSIKKALSTYAGKSKPQGAVLRVARELGADERTLQKAPSRVSDVQRERIISQSKRALASSMDLNEQARVLLSTDNIGSRIYGGTVEIWKGEADRNAAIMEFFNVSNMMAVIEKIESKLGVKIYEPDKESSTYQDVTSKIMSYVSSLSHEETE